VRLRIVWCRVSPVAGVRSPVNWGTMASATCEEMASSKLSMSVNFSSNCPALHRRAVAHTEQLNRHSNAILSASDSTVEYESYSQFATGYQRI
jgi:hypothetical protein